MKQGLAPWLSLTMLFLWTAHCQASDSPLNFNDLFGKIQQNFDEVFVEPSEVPLSDLSQPPLPPTPISLQQPASPARPRLAPLSGSKLRRRLDSINQLLEEKIDLAPAPKKSKRVSAFPVRKIRQHLRGAQDVPRRQAPATSNLGSFDKVFEIKNDILQSKINQLYHEAEQRGRFLSLNRVQVTQQDVCGYFQTRLGVSCFGNGEQPESYYDPRNKPLAKLRFFFNTHKNITPFFDPLSTSRRSRDRADPAEVREFNQIVNDIYQLSLDNIRLASPHIEPEQYQDEFGESGLIDPEFHEPISAPHLMPQGYQPDYQPQPPKMLLPVSEPIAPEPQDAYYEYFPHQFVKQTASDAYINQINGLIDQLDSKPAASLPGNQGQGLGYSSQDDFFGLWPGPQPSHPKRGINSHEPEEDHASIPGFKVQKVSEDATDGSRAKHSHSNPASNQQKKATRRGLLRRESAWGLAAASQFPVQVASAPSLFQPMGQTELNTLTGTL